MIATSACAADVHEPNVHVTQTRHPKNDGRIHELTRNAVLVDNVESYCLTLIARDSKRDRDRIAKHEPAFGYTLLDEETAEVWTGIVLDHATTMRAHDNFKVVAEIDYRCSLPGMKIGSVDDVGINGSANGTDAKLFEIMAVSGKAKGKHELMGTAPLFMRV